MCFASSSPCENENHTCSGVGKEYFTLDKKSGRGGKHNHLLIKSHRADRGKGDNSAAFIALRVQPGDHHIKMGGVFSQCEIMACIRHNWLIPLQVLGK